MRGCWSQAENATFSMFHSFVQQHRDILPELKQVHNVVSVLILPSRCPVTKALNDLERHEQGENPPPEEPEIPSQSYWTTLYGSLEGPLEYCY